MHPTAVMTSSGPQLLERRANGPRSERWRAQLDGSEVELRIVKQPFATDAGRFVSRTEALMQVDHPSLRMVRGALVLPDGRPAAVLSLVDWVALSASPKQTPQAVLELGIELSEALATLHASGLVVGVFDGDDIYPGQPAVLDASLAGLALDGDTPESDVAMLCQALLGALGAGKDVGPLESLLQRARGHFSAAQLGQELTALKTRFQARTVSGQHATVEQVEVVEPDLTGKVLQHWRLERVLGEGAMARVYLATDERSGARVALKVLKQEHTDDAEHVQRFIQEVRAVEAISNPHIVKVTDFGDQPFGAAQRVVFCAMELLEGQALSDAMAHGEAFGVVRAVRIAQQTARALHAAHQVGVVHRDVKPENLFLMRDGAQEFVKVLDFGVAKLLKPLGNLPKVGTKAGIVVGTPEYMAPEQALGTGTDPRVDVYAVGLVLYELLSGEQPFKGETFGKLVLEIAQTPVPPLPAATRAGERLPPGLAAVVLKCLEKHPDGRYATAAELADALEPFAAPRWSRSQLPAVRVNEDAVSEVSEAELAAAVRPSRAPLIVAAVVVLALVLGAVLAFASGGEGEKATKSAEAVTQAPTPQPAPPPPEPVKPPPPPAEVTLDVQSTPPGAKVKRAGALLGVTPLHLTLARADTAEALSLELANYVAETREVTLSEDVALSVELKPVPVAKKKPAPPKKAPKKKKR